LAEWELAGGSSKATLRSTSKYKRSWSFLTFYPRHRRFPNPTSQAMTSTGGKRSSWTCSNGTAPNFRFFANPLPPYHGEKVRRSWDETGFETGLGGGWRWGQSGAQSKKPSVVRGFGPAHVAMSKLVIVILEERLKLDHSICSECRCANKKFDGGNSGIRTPDLRIIRSTAQKKSHLKKKSTAAFFD